MRFSYSADCSLYHELRAPGIHTFELDAIDLALLNCFRNVA